VERIAQALATGTITGVPSGDDWHLTARRSVQ
jgi:hypothetical protein